MSNKGSIEKDIKNIKQYINLVLDKGYCDCNELNVISTGKYCDGSKNVAYSMQNILAEREQMLKAINTVEKEKGEWIEECVQKDKRIKELENKQRKYFINKQVVIDKMEELNKEIKSCDEIDAIFKIKQQQILQELLEGEKNEF